MKSLWSSNVLLITLTAVSLFGWQPEARAALIQWSISSGGNGHFYDTTPAGSSWTDAEAYAISQGGHLVSIDDSAENAFIQATFLTGPSATEDFWIGLNSPVGDFTDPATWVWVNGSTSNYRNWRPGQPDFGTGNDRFAAINFTGDATWDNYPNSSFRMPRGIYEVEAVPVPSAVWLFGSGLLGLVGVAQRKKIA
ncbi:MAG TPA: lectin-like protein [Candidatus Methylomirabilis sp.]|nr:lectin-like protein [Candidatus Methylomirabilis sp.]